MALYFNKKENQYGVPEISPISNEDVTDFKKSKFSPPMPNDEDTKLFEYVEACINKSSNYMKDFSDGLKQNIADYYTIPTFLDSVKGGNDPSLDQNLQDTIIVPAVVRRFTDLMAHWVTREIYKADPFVQFTYYSDDSNVRRAQRLLERKYQGDSNLYGGREKLNEGCIDCFLMGTGIFKAEFHQERMLLETVPDDELFAAEEDDSDLSEIQKLVKPESDEEDHDVADGIQQKLEITNQYAKYKPIFINHFICDPNAQGKDWRYSSYLGDIEYVTANEVWERFSSIKGMKSKLEAYLNSSTNGFQTKFNQYGLNQTMNWTDLNPGDEGDKIHAIIHLYNKYTEICVLNNEFVIYNKIRNSKVAKAGIFPYYVLKFPGTSNSLFSVGLGHILRGIQEELTIITSLRLKYLDRLVLPFIAYKRDAVNPADLQQLSDLLALPMDEIGAIQAINFSTSSETIFLNAEKEGFDRARQYAGIPDILDSSSTKSHLGGISQRMNAAQVQFDVILERVRDCVKQLHQKMHIMSLAYLSGDIPVEGSIDKDMMSNVLTEVDLKMLADQSNLVLSLNAGVNVNEEQLASVSQLLNTAIMGALVQQLPLEVQMKLARELFTMGNLENLESIFSDEVIQQVQQKQEAAQQQQQAPEGMPGGMPGMPPQ